jgi:hypothetical protein
MMEGVTARCAEMGSGGRAEASAIRISESSTFRPPGWVRLNIRVELHWAELPVDQLAVRSPQVFASAAWSCGVVHCSASLIVDGGLAVYQG